MNRRQELESLRKAEAARSEEIIRLRRLVDQLERENVNLLRMRAATLAEDNERLARHSDVWVGLTSQEEMRYRMAPVQPGDERVDRLVLPSGDGVDHS